MRVFRRGGVRTVFGGLASLASSALALGALAGTGASGTGSIAPDSVSLTRLSEKTLVVAIEVDRDGARVVGFTRKDRPFVAAANLVAPKAYEEGVGPQFEVSLLGRAGAVYTDRREVGPLCLSHDPDAPPHVEGDTILMHRDSFVIELPELAAFDRVEVAYYERGRSAPSRKLLATSTLTAPLFESAGTRLAYSDLAFAEPGAPVEPEAPSTNGAVHWPEEFGDPDVYKVYGNAAETGQRINITIVPDGYRYAEKSLMQTHADTLVAYFRGKTPYKEHDPFLNYTLVYAYSNSPGTDECDCGVVKNTAMSTRFPNQGYPCGDSGNRCLYYGGGCDTDTSHHMSSAELRAPATDKTIVMVNTGRYGGCGGLRAVYSAANVSATEIAVHELGHSLGALADEYGGTVACGSFASGPNTSKDAVNGAWPEWVPDLGPPTQGAQYYEQCIYRPSLTCDMRSLGFEFCPVCNQQWSLVTFLHARVNPTAPLASATPGSPLTVQTGTPVLFSAETRLSSGAVVTNSMTWSLQGPGDPGPVVVATGTATYEPTFGDEGTHVLTFEIVADTNFVKPAKYGANRDTATWTIDVIRPTPGEVSPPGSASPQLFTGPETMVWEDAAASGSTTFNVYRGDAALLGSGDYGTCFRAGLASSSTTDTDVPALGACFTYLVTGKTSGGEGSMGSDSSGNVRSNLHSCP